MFWDPFRQIKILKIIFLKLYAQKMAEMMTIIQKAFLFAAPAPELKYLENDTVQALIQSSFGKNFGYKALESACLVLRMVRSLDSRLKNSVNVDKFFDLMDKVEAYGLSKNSFENNKHVVSIEGLSGCGKSSLCRYLNTLSNQRIKVISADNNPILSNVSDVFLNLPEPISNAYELFVNYVKAYEVMTSQDSVFIMDSYHHAVAVKKISESAESQDEISSLPSKVFDWPFDLPEPQMVVFLSVDTTVRVFRVPDSPAACLDYLTAKDARANLVYQLNRGPGTVGIDGNVALEEVARTTVEALDYYGVYSISRAIIPLPYSYSNPVSPACRSARSNSDYFPEPENMSEYDKENESFNRIETPDRVVSDRRISMGVYGMYSKL